MTLNNFLLPFAVCLLCNQFGNCAGAVTSPTNGNASKGENELHTELFERRNYNIHVRPVANDSVVLKLYLGMALINIVKLDEELQVLHTNTWFRMSWNDRNLTWTPSDYGNITMIRVPSSLIWKPDIYLYNTARADFEHFSSTVKVLIMSDGRVLWVPPALFSSFCPMNWRYFPYDTQACTLKFGSWTYNGNLVEIHPFSGDEPSVDMTDYVPHSEWEVVGADGRISTVYYPCCPEPYMDASFTLTLRRLAAPYVYAVILPCVVVEVVTLATFWLPLDAKERLTTGMLNLVVLVILNSDMSQMLPTKYGSTAPFIVTMYDFTFVMLVVSLIFSIGSLNVHHHIVFGSMPAWIRSLFLQVLSRLLFVDTKATSGRTHANRQLADETAADNMDEAHRAERDAYAAIHNEWKQVAKVIDRLLFVIFLICFVIAWIIFATYSSG
ncbi:PREDICTED: acetylcholine receptor subunit alpha-like [Priapulus caudatus]|uniref:Acetylcholine receptor subunit alpha-like n=1 Tax=Priapulus caudatus TaxID=37621 RepID=A0ABM1F8C4_PRICU|nr:PREDICTED: acetylcholine receptor subunit alpha-like [Priapulus caudatus]